MTPRSNTVPRVLAANQGMTDANVFRPRSRLRPGSFPSSRRADRLTVTIFTMSFLAVVLYDSHILSLYNLGDIEIGVNRSLYIVAILGILVGVSQAQMLPLALALTGLAYFTALIFQFVYIGSAMDILAGFGFSPFYARLQLLCIPMITALFVRGKASQILFTIFLVSTIYFAAYLLSSIYALSSASIDFRAAAFVADYDGRGGRIVLNNALSSLALFTALASIRDRRHVWAWIVMVLGCLCIYISASRFYQFCVVFTVISYFILKRPSRVGVVCGALFAGLAIFMLFQIFSGQNPYTFLSDDISLNARANSYDAAFPIMVRYFFTGVGFAEQPTADAALVHSNVFFWTDLGPIGIFYVGGLLGLIIFLGMTLVCFLSPRLISRSELSGPLYTGISLSAICIALYGLIAPTLWYNGLEVFIFVAAGICARRASVLGQAPVVRPPNVQLIQGAR